MSKGERNRIKIRVRAAMATAPVAGVGTDAPAPAYARESRYEQTVYVREDGLPADLRHLARNTCPTYRTTP